MHKVLFFYHRKHDSKQEGLYYVIDLVRLLLLLFNFTRHIKNIIFITKIIDIIILSTLFLLIIIFSIFK